MLPHPWLPLSLALLLAACDPAKDETGERDADGDGYSVAEDCDDADAAVHPGATEVCNGQDDDCDGQADEDATDAPTWYADVDGDGFGAPATGARACAQPSGFVADATDRNGLTTTFERPSVGGSEYFPSDILITVTGPFGAQSTLAVGGDGYFTAMLDPMGAEIDLRYATDGLLASFEDPEGGTTSFTWDEDGRLLTETTERGGERSLARSGDTEDYLVTWTSALDDVTTYDVVALTEGGSTETITDPVGLVTTRTFYTDSSTLVRAPDGSTVETSYDADPIFGMQAPVTTTTVSTPGGISTEIAVDRDSELVDEGDPTLLAAWTETTTVDGYDYVATWDPADLTLYGETPTGITWSETRDASGNLVSAAVGDLDPWRRCQAPTLSILVSLHFR